MPDFGSGAVPETLYSEEWAKLKARSTNLLQWHTWFWCVGMLCAVRALYDIIVHDFIAGDWMTFTDDPGKNYDKKYQELAQGKGHGTLRICAILAPFVAFAAACLSVTHVFVFTRTLHHRKMAKFLSINGKKVPDGAKSCLTTLMDNVYARNYNQPTTSWSPLYPKALRVNTVVKVKNRDGEINETSQVAKILHFSNPEGGEGAKYHILYGKEQDGEIHYEQEKHYKKEEDLEAYVPLSNHWNLTLSEDLALLVGIMPMIFAVACLLAEIRFLQVLTNSNMAHNGTVTEDTRLSYELWRQQTGVMDLEAASAFQYLTVFAFAQLCAKYFNLGDLEEKMEVMLDKLNRRNEAGDYRSSTLGEAGDYRENTLGTTAVGRAISEANEEHEKTLWWAGMQGIGAYIVVGTLRSLFNLGMAMAPLWYHDQQKIVDLSASVMTRVQPVFAFLALLCLWNWSTISQLKRLRSEDALGDHATKKFIGLRILLLVSDMDRSFLFLLNHWHKIDANEESLIHVCVMSCLCFLVALWNYYMWIRVPQENIVARSASEPLLG